MAFLAEIKAAAPGVVEENSVGQAFAQSDKERNVLVEWIGGLAPAESIGVPHCEGAVAAVHGAGFVAQAIVAFVFRHFFPDAHAPAFPAHGEVGIIGYQNVANIAEKIDEQRRLFYSCDDISRGDANFVFRVVNFHGSCFWRFDDRPGKILRERSRRRDSDAENAFAKNGDPHFDFSGS
jgi:hypothetical protein